MYNVGNVTFLDTHLWSSLSVRCTIWKILQVGFFMKSRAAKYTAFQFQVESTKHIFLNTQDYDQNGTMLKDFVGTQLYKAIGWLFFAKLCTFIRAQNCNTGLFLLITKMSVKFFLEHWHQVYQEIMLSSS